MHTPPANKTDQHANHMHKLMLSNSTSDEAIQFYFLRIGATAGESALETLINTHTDLDSPLISDVHRSSLLKLLVGLERMDLIRKFFERVAPEPEKASNLLLDIPLETHLNTEQRKELLLYFHGKGNTHFLKSIIRNAYLGYFRTAPWNLNQSLDYIHDLLSTIPDLIHKEAPTIVALEYHKMVSTNGSKNLDEEFQRLVDLHERHGGLFQDETCKSSNSPIRQLLMKIRDDEWSVIQTIEALVQAGAPWQQLLDKKSLPLKQKNLLQQVPSVRQALLEMLVTEKTATSPTKMRHL